MHSLINLTYTVMIEVAAGVMKKVQVNFDWGTNQTLISPTYMRRSPQPALLHTRVTLKVAPVPVKGRYSGGLRLNRGGRQATLDSPFRAQCAGLSRTVLVVFASFSSVATCLARMSRLWTHHDRLG